MTITKFAPMLLMWSKVLQIKNDDMRPIKLINGMQ